MIKLRMCEVVQQVNLLCEAFGLNDIVELKEKIESIISTYKTIKKACYIVHDKDVYTIDDEKKNNNHKADSLKAPHIHIYLYFGVCQDIELVSKWFNVPLQQIEKIKGRWNNALEYATHKNATNKYQYSNEEVYCYNMDYQTEMLKNDYTGKYPQALIDYMNAEINIKELRNLLTDEEKLKFGNKIDIAQKNRLDKVKLRMNSIRKKVIYIYGKTGGCGKTRFAKWYAKNILQYMDDNIYMSSSSNDILNDYEEEKVLIIDDFRDSCMSYNDLLKMIDPYNSTSVKSRFHNKFLECEYILITSVIHPVHLYENVEEDKGQLYRRLDNVITIDEKGIIYSQESVKNEKGFFSLNGLKQLDFSIYDIFDDLNKNDILEVESQNSFFEFENGIKQFFYNKQNEKMNVEAE